MSEVVDVQDLDQLLDVLSNNEHVVVDFSAPAWCAPCRKFAPHFEKAATLVENTVFVVVDIDQDAAFSTEYIIKSVPTVVEFIGGERIRNLKAQTVVKLISELASPGPASP